MRQLSLIALFAACANNTGKPGCPTPFALCGTTCTAIAVDPANCGSCGNSCAAGQRCVSGSCTVSCPDGTMMCGSSCAGVLTDNANCGSCGNQCPAGQVCSNGQCGGTCAAGYRDCGGYCADLAYDSQNCGSCGTLCPPGQRCSGTPTPTCTASCASGTTSCGASCVDTMTDSANCGGCGIACPTGETCVAGACQCDLSGLALGRLSTCGLRSDGTVLCAGGLNNANGTSQNPNGTRAYNAAGFGTSLPSPVPGLTSVQQVDSGNGYVCALKTDGTVWCVGSNRGGRLGDSELVPSPKASPVQVVVSPAPSPLANVKQLSVGGDHACALDGSGVIWCWGDFDGDSVEGLGALGDGTSAGTSSVAVQVSLGALTGVQKVVAGAAHSCALAGDGSVWCWGANAVGQCGTNDTVTPVLTPRQIGITNVVDLASKWDHTCALRNDGSAWCWGRNQFDQTGIDRALANPVASPSPVPSLTGAVEIGVGTAHSCARKADGTVWCWGRNARGELGDGTLDVTGQSGEIIGGGAPSLTPRPVVGADGMPIVARSIGIGHGRSCAVVGPSSHPWCWGNNLKGQALLTVPLSRVASPIFSCGR